MSTKEATPRRRRIRPRLLAAEAMLRPHAVAEYAFVRLAANDVVAVAVIRAVADEANYPAELIQLNYVLCDAPLLLDADGLRDLAERLTSYVRRTKPAANVGIAEVNAAGLQVGTLVTLVKKKV